VVVHFNKGELPPVDAFWSLTLYTTDGYFAKNLENKYSVHDFDAFEFNEDCSLDIHVSRTQPEGVKKENWLPTGDGTFNLMLRLYIPQDKALESKWQLPDIKAVA